MGAKHKCPICNSNQLKEVGFVTVKGKKEAVYRCRKCSCTVDADQLRSRKGGK